jgi:hypothetical protein
MHTGKEYKEIKLCEGTKGIKALKESLYGLLGSI